MPVAVHYRVPPVYYGPPPEAEARARKLLAGFLTEEQRRQLAKFEAFVVTGSRGGRYVVTPLSLEFVFDPVYNLARGYLPVNAGSLPPSDRALATKLAVEADEDAFIRYSCQRSIGAPERRSLGPLFQLALAGRVRAKWGDRWPSWLAPGGPPGG